MKKLSLEPTLHNGEYYYTVTQFAHLVGRDRAQIYMLFNQGNKIRKLHGTRIGNKPMILTSEVKEFPFDSRKYKGEVNESCDSSGISQA